MVKIKKDTKKKNRRMNNKDVENHKTFCCKASWYVKSRANFRCKECDKNVTMEIIFLTDMIEKENKEK